MGTPPEASQAAAPVVVIFVIFVIFVVRSRSPRAPSGRHGHAVVAYAPAVFSRTIIGTPSAPWAVPTAS